MTIEELRAYAEERGLPEKKIAALVAELHPDENGKLSPQESIEACYTLNYIADTRENIKALLEMGRSIRNEAKNKK
jgi:hypothetical protein